MLMNVIAVEKASDSMKWEADFLYSVGNDISWYMTTSYLHSPFPVLLFYPSSGGLLSAGLCCSSGIIAELSMCRGCWAKRCSSQCCPHLPQIQENKELAVSDPGWGWSWLAPKFKTGTQLVCMSCKWQDVRSSFKPADSSAYTFGALRCCENT